MAESAVAFHNGANLQGDGTVCTAVDISQARIFMGGLAFDNNANIIVDSLGAISTTFNGFPLTSAGAMAVSRNAAASIGPAGLGVDAGGRICLSQSVGPNLFLSPNTIGDANWSLAGSLAATNAATDPIGGNAATNMTFNGGTPVLVSSGANQYLVFQSVAMTAGNYICGLWAKGINPGTMFINVSPDAVTYQTKTCVLNNTWQWFSFQITVTTASWFFVLGYDGRNPADIGTTTIGGAPGVSLWGATLQAIV